MRQDCVYDPVRDLRPVDPTGFVDIVKANATSMVDVEVDFVEEQFNQIDDPRSIGYRPKDDFELQQANRVIVDYKPESTT